MVSGTATLKPLVGAEIGDGGSNHAERIHAMVRVKPMVFGGENGVHQRLGEVLVTNQATLGAACAKEGGDGLGLKPVGLKGGHIVEVGNRHEAITFEIQSRRTFDHLTVAEKRLGAGSDFQPVGRDGKAPDTSDILTLGVAGLLEETRDACGHLRLVHNCTSLGAARITAGLPKTFPSKRASMIRENCR